MIELGYTDISRLRAIKGLYSPEQFGVFLNMSLDDMEKNYLVQFHECFHHWQSIFTPYGHLKWWCFCTVSSEVIDSWLTATNSNPSERVIPIGSLLPSTDHAAIRGVAQVFVQDCAIRMVSLVERCGFDDVLRKVIPLSEREMCPIITLDGENYQLNGIDILESFAKFQEATYAFIVEGKSLDACIDKSRLGKEYYSALQYYIEKVGTNRIVEFPVACELALAVEKYCTFNATENWRDDHPAWRFIRIVDEISKNKPLDFENVQEVFLEYCENILVGCGYSSTDEIWKGARDYASQPELRISRDMLRAIDYKIAHPWILSFPFMDGAIFREIGQFQPYFYITTDSTLFSIENDIVGNEVIFENHYQALAHQIRGNMSMRCLYRDKLQCGYSYYGLVGCQYQRSGQCDGHIDRFSELPAAVLDSEENIVDGCAFELLLCLMGISIRDVVITDVRTKIDLDMLKDAATQLAKK